MAATLLLAGGAEAGPADITVDTTSDVADFGGAQQVGDLPGPDDEVSLREAIIAANNTPGPQVIGFAVPASDPGFSGQWFTIRPTTWLPPLTDNRTTIDGATQAAFTGDTNPAGPEIELNGSLTTGCCTSPSGLYLAGDRNRVHHLVINGFVADGEGVRISGSQNVVTGSYIGLDPTGTTAVPNRFNGLSVDTGTGNRIGGKSARERNVISGNPAAGIAINAVGNLVEGNFIGTDWTGTVDVGNTEGVLLNLSGPSNNVIRGNVLSGNDNTGVFIRGKGNTVSENLIGTDASGTAPLGNQGGGVLLRAGDGVSDADGNRIVGNVVSANGPAGVWFATDFGVEVESDDNLVVGNLIGTDVNGNVVPGMGNSPTGVDYNNEDGTGNVVSGNVIAANGNGTTGGVQVSGDGLTVVGNAIFENVGYGVIINTASGIVVRRNSVRANAVDGIFLAVTASGNSVVANFLRANLEHDCHDDSLGSGTAGTANTWRRNDGETSLPPGLCVPGG